MKVPLHNLKITKTEAATRQIDRAIDALILGEFDIAITLAGAAEGMFERDGLYLFSYLVDSPKAKEFPKKEWINTLNHERDWLKHPSGNSEIEIHPFVAANMIVRAATKMEKWSPKMDEFKVWFLDNIDSLAPAGQSSTS